VLRTRVISAILLAPLILVVAYVGGPAWLALALVAGVQAWREMALLLQRDQYRIDFALGVFFVVGALVEAYLHATGALSFDLLRPLLAGLIVFSLIWALYSRSVHPTADWGVTVASAVYLGFLLGHFITLRERTAGFQWLCLAFLLCWMIDTMAYFVGSRWGKHRLWPRLSPKKTWEGLIGGSLAALLLAPFLAHWLIGLSPLLGLLLGALAAALAPFGDFAVSLFKRMAKTKDSSQLIPGHGGVLDRLDSLLFVIPMVCYFALAVSGS
jgi:phosphatidate cytidylyltransferase